MPSTDSNLWIVGLLTPDRSLSSGEVIPSSALAALICRPETIDLLDTMIHHVSYESLGSYNCRSHFNADFDLR